jgi:hypothetical protein
MRRISLISILCALAVTACEGVPTSPGPRSDLAMPSLDAGGQGVVQSATGGAHRLSGGEMFILAFTANTHADGSTTGRYHVDLQSIGATFDVDVTCLSVVGNRAWIAGIIERSDHPLVREGTVSYFYAIDNGEGTGDPTDIISAIRINDLGGQDLVFCAERPLGLSSRPIDFGNIQVRP